MRAHLLIGFIIVLLASLPVKAQVDTIEIKELTIIAQKSPGLYSGLNRIVNVISKKQINYFPVQSISELLENTMNVDVRQRGAPGIQSDINIMGGNFDQSLILINGIRVNDPQTGHHSFNIPIDVESLDRVEILTGSGSRVLGANAFTGAVNLIAGTTGENHLKVSLSGGQYGFVRTLISGSLSTKYLRNYISVSRSSSTGYTNNTDYLLSNFFYHGSVKINKTRFGFQAGYQDKSFGANSFYTPKYPNQFEHTKSSLMSLVMDSEGRIRMKTSVYWRRHQDRFELFRSDPEPWYKGHNYHLTNVYGGNVNASITSGLGKTLLGLEIHNEEIRSNVLGLPMNDTLPVPGEPEGCFTRNDGRLNTSVFAEQTASLGRFSISAGLMANWNSKYDWKSYWGIDLSYLIGSSGKFYFSVNQSFRLPTFTDLYYEGPTNIGNPDLLPEEALSFETGYKFLRGRFEGNGRMFIRNGKNIIDWARIADSLKWESLNITELQTYGMEVSGKISGGAGNQRGFHLNFVQLSYSYLNTSKQSGDYISRYVLDYLKHKIDLILNHSLPGSFNVSWKMSYQERAGTYVDFKSGTEVTYSPVLLADLRINWHYKRFEAFCEALNIFNIEYFDHGNVPMPGRWIKAGISFIWRQKSK